jgi:hypothetical protein
MCSNNGHLSDIFRTFIGQYPSWKLEETTGGFCAISEDDITWLPMDSRSVKWAHEGLNGAQTGMEGHEG